MAVADQPQSIAEFFKLDSAWLKRQAKPYRSFGMDPDDLFQEAAKAWLEASHRVSPKDNPGFRAYALPFVRRALLDYAFANQRIVSVDRSRRVQSAILDLRRNMARGAPPVEIRKAIADRHRMSLGELDAWLNYLLGEDADCHALLGKDIPSTVDMLELIAWSEEEAQLEACRRGVSRLPARESKLINARYFSEEPKTLAKVSQSMGISTTRAWQLERQAISRLQAIMENLPLLGQA